MRPSLDISRPNNVWETPPGEEWALVSENMFAAHTRQTFKRNIKWLFTIRDQGWDFFADEYNGKV